MTLVYAGTIRCSKPDGNIIFFSQNVRTGSGAHTVFLIIYVTQVLSPEIKQSGREAYRLSKSSAEVKNEWRYTSPPPPHVFIACITDLRSYVFSDVRPKKLVKSLVLISFFPVLQAVPSQSDRDCMF